MSKRLLIITFLCIVSLLCNVDACGQDNSAPHVVHPAEGKTQLRTDEICLTFVTRKHNFSGGAAETKDADIRSPKSVNIKPGNKKYYVNSLEGTRTVVFDFKTGEKLKVIWHKFDASHKDLWAPDSGLFPCEYKYSDPYKFSGKPVESTFSHGGRFLWVPYYRRSYDLNAQDPSAVAVIDTQKDTIVRLFETGPLPKMIEVSPDGKTLAIAHWGNNTIGVMDISGAKPQDWHYTACYEVDKKLKLDLSRTVSVNRDVNSGYCLRGTTFTPDSRYLMVACMGGHGGIAVVDLKTSRYLGRLLGGMSNMRHIIIKDGWLYASINASGYVQKLALSTILDSIEELRTSETHTSKLSGWINCKVPAGARTIVASPDGKYIFAACNFSSKIAVVRADDMTLIGTIDADSFPVGLDISEDGRYLLSTSQARNAGGNAVDIFRIDYK